MKLLFVCNNLNIGGIQRALVNLLNEISESHDVTLFLFYPEGALKSELSPKITLIGGNRFTQILGMSQAEAKKSGFFAWIWRSLWVCATKIIGCRLPYGFLTRLQHVKGQYDCAVSYMQNSAYKYFYGGCNEFVINSVRAKKKISFIHCDFHAYPGNNPYNRGYYRHFDTIACVSDSCKAVFDAECPSYTQKTVSVRNCFNFEQMQQLADEFEPERTDGVLNIFTSARISEEKGIFRMIPILAELKKEGCDFIWRIAGGGPQYDAAVKLAGSLGLENSIIFLGMQKNPYPYYKNADLLLVPSYNEAAPMVFTEAMCFGIPIFTTKTTSAEEIVASADAGFVCENTDDDIKTELKKLLQAPQYVLDKKYVFSADNSFALEQFNNMIS